MNEFTEVSAAHLSRIRGGQGLNQDDVAKLLGIAQTAVSKIENGSRALSDSEKKLLDWYFFGIVPPRVASITPDLKGVLEFDDAEWRMIGIMANRDGNKTPGQWIASRIRDHIAPAMAIEDREESWQRRQNLKVAEEPVSYRAKKKPGGQA